MLLAITDFPGENLTLAHRRGGDGGSTSYLLGGVALEVMVILGGLTLLSDSASLKHGWRRRMKRKRYFFFVLELFFYLCSPRAGLESKNSCIFVTFGRIYPLMDIEVRF
jgi:hypothetical protein